MNSPSETLRQILEAVEGHGKYHTSDYDGPVMTVDDAIKAILNKLPEKKDSTEDINVAEENWRLGFNEAVDTIKQLLEGK